MSRGDVRACGWAIAAALTFGLATVPAQAAVIIVDTGGDAAANDLTMAGCTLRQAIHAANTDTAVGGCEAGSGADGIQFAVSVTGTIVLQPVRLAVTAFANGDILLPITAPLVITGPGSAVLAVSGGHAPAAPTVNRMFWVSDGVASTLFAAAFSGLTLRDNRMVGGSGACLGSREHLTLQDIVFDGCISEGNAGNTGLGGALFVGAGLTDGVFTGARPNVTMSNVAVRNSKALRGSSTSMPFGGGIALGTGGPGDPTANPAVAPSGTQVGAVVMTDVVIENNEAEVIGGLLVRQATSVALTRMTLRGNRATGAFNANPNLNAGWYGGADIRLFGATNTTRGGTLTLTDVTISNNEAQGDWGGGIGVRYIDTLNVLRTTISGNKAKNGVGGADFRHVNALTVSDSDVTGNQVTQGQMGGLYIDSVGTATLNNVNLRNNSATASDPNVVFAERGGGNFQNIGTFVYQNSEISGNSAVGTGGLRVAQSTNVVLNNLLVANNTATNGSPGGFVVANNGTVAMDGVDVVNNHATRPEGSTRWAGSGAGFIFENGTASYRNGVISGNSSFNNEILSLRGCRAPYPNNNNNTAPDFWVYCSDTSRTVNLENLAVVGNTVGVGNPTGGGLIVFVGSAGTYNIRNTTISGNNANGQAGLSILAHHPTVAEATKVNLFNSTITRNSGSSAEALSVEAWVPSPNGGNVVISGKVNVESSVLAGRAPSSTVANAFNQAGPVTHFKNTFIENASGVPAGVCGSNGNLCGTDAMLAPLADNGGLTLTHRPLSGSPLIDAGSDPASLATDQRGYGHARVVGSAADIGAFETNPVSVGSSYSRDYVQKAYVAYYGRPADPGGHAFWATRMDDKGGSLDAIIKEFGNSDEFNRRYGGLSYVELVTKIYRQALGRDPDQGGLDWYVAELEAGRRTLQTITLDVLNGATTAPDSTVVANRLTVAAHFSAAVEAGCDYAGEQTGVDSLAGVTDVFATVIAAMAAIDSRCGP